MGRSYSGSFNLSFIIYTSICFVYIYLEKQNNRTSSGHYRVYPWKLSSNMFTIQLTMCNKWPQKPVQVCNYVQSDGNIYEWNKN